MKKIFYIILGGIIFSTITVLAATTLSSNEVFYKRVNNQDMTVQQALDDLYTKASSSSCPEGSICISNDDFGTPIYRAWNETPTASTSAGDHTVYLAKWSDSQLGACIKIGTTEYCFRYNNWFAEREHLQQVFSGENDSCDVGSSYVDCETSDDFGCYVLSNGNVDCYDYVNYETCDVHGDGSVTCSQ